MADNKKTQYKKPNLPKKRRKKKHSAAAVLSIVIAIVLYFSLCALDYFDIVDIDLGDANVLNLIGGEQHTITPAPTPNDGELLFHFIDVGQGDSILITGKMGNILVDTSEKRAKEDLIAYLDAAKIEKLDYLVLTHPDADHIGNAEYIIRNYEVGTVVMSPFVGTTKTYEGVLDAIEEKRVNVLIGEGGNSFTLGSLKCIFIAPVEEYDDPNEMSLVIKAIYGDTSVMLTGDAEKESEADILKKWSAETLKCDILKVGHHGSNSSTTDNFLKYVNPKVAIISCGEGNKYGHPHKEIVDKLLAKGIEVYRTDENGTIVYKTDGKEFTLVKTQK